jgi:hypothetical protein
MRERSAEVLLQKAAQAQLRLDDAQFQLRPLQPRISPKLLSSSRLPSFSSPPRRTIGRGYPCKYLTASVNFCYGIS